MPESPASLFSERNLSVCAATSRDQLLQRDDYSGNVVIALKTPYDDGTTHVVLSPMEFMGLAVGLVTDMGSILAHGSIVAREYGIPAVLGVGDETKRIAHGQMITIDGYAGTVEIHEQIEESA